MTVDLNFKEWFVADRARALATVILTRRTDLVITEEKKDLGLDYVVYIKNGQSAHRSFGVLLRATMTPVAESQANAQLKPTMGSLKALGTFLPVCIFYFTIKDDQGYFTWGLEPVIAEGQVPKLKYHPDAECVTLTTEVLDKIVAQVLAWYELLERELFVGNKEKG